MDFKSVSKRIVKIWEEFYIDYKLVDKILSPAEKIYMKRQNAKYGTKEFDSYLESGVDKTPLLENQEEPSEKDNEEIKKMKTKFYNQMKLEFKKINKFVELNIKKVIDKKLLETKNQIKHAKKVGQFKINEDTFELALKEIYKDINLTLEFLSVNYYIKDILLRKYKKFIGEEGNETISDTMNQNSSAKLNPDDPLDIKNIEEKINSYLNNSPIPGYKDKLERLSKEVETIFQECFFYKYHFETEKILEKYIKPVRMSESQSLILGLFLGLLIFQLLIICILAYYYDIDMDNDPDFKSVFPMFRGFWVVCLYWWLHGVNIKVWSSADISYRLIFGIDNNYSKPIEIFKRAAGFTFILLTCLLIYMIKRIYSGAFFGIFDPIPIHSLPLICWGSLLIYWFCPFNIWNYEGRVFFGNFAKESFGSFLLKTGFKHAFFMGQVCTFIATFRDIEYTICYFAYYNAPLWAKKEYCSKTRGVYFFICFVPNFIRILQNSKEIYDSGKWTPKFYSICQYCFSLSVSFMSFLMPNYPFLRKFWLLGTLVSSCFSFGWDLIIDFGFLKEGPGYPLRDKLYYKPKIVYYLIIVYDFILRFFWLLTISPEVLGSLFRPETLSIVLSSLEITRRICWNFLKLENKHIDISKEYKVSNDVEMPFVKIGHKYVNNESNLLSIMELNRSELIQVEIEKVLQQSKVTRSRYQKSQISDLKDGKEKINEELNEFLATYEVNCRIIDGTIIEGKIASRKLPEIAF